MKGRNILRRDDSPQKETAGSVSASAAGEADALGFGKGGPTYASNSLPKNTEGLHSRSVPSDTSRSFRASNFAGFFKRGGTSSKHAEKLNMPEIQVESKKYSPFNASPVSNPQSPGSQSISEASPVRHHRLTSRSMMDLTDSGNGSSTKGGGMLLTPPRIESEQLQQLPFPDGTIKKSGWVNWKSTTTKKGANWSAQYGVLHGSTLHLYEPPPLPPPSSLPHPSQSFQPKSSAVMEPSPTKAVRRSTTTSTLATIVGQRPDTEDSDIQTQYNGGRLQVHIDGQLTISGLFQRVFTQPEEEKIALQTIGLWCPAWAISEELQFLRQNDPAKFALNFEFFFVRWITESPGIVTNTKIANLLTRYLEESDIALARQNELIQLLNNTCQRLQGRATMPTEAPIVQTDTWLQMSPIHLAEQVKLFHLRYQKAWDISQDLSVYFLDEPLNHPLIADNTTSHFLSRLILSQLRDSHVLETRVQIITHWIEMGQASKASGDLNAWLAIARAILSPPVLAIDRTWSCVPATLTFEVTSEWAPVLLDLDRRFHHISCDFRSGEDPHVLSAESTDSAEVVPYFSDLRAAINEERAVLLSDVSIYINVDANDQPITYSSPINLESLKSTYSKITVALEAWKKHISVHAYPNIDDSGRDNIGAEQLAAIFESLHVSSASTYLDSLDSLVVTFWNVDHPFDDFDGTSLPVLQDFNPLRKIHVSLLFTDVIPCFKFFDAADLLEVSKSRLARMQNSYKSSQWSSLRRTNSFPPSRRLSIYTTGDKDLDNTTRHRLAGLSGQSSKFLANVRDLAGIEQRLLHVQDGELILKTSTGPTLQSQRASMVEVTSKRLSTNSSRRESPSIHTPLSPVIASGEFGLQNIEKSTLDVVTKAGSLDKLIDLLIIGIEDFSSYLQTKELHNHIEPSSLVLRMDMESYTSTFLATYKSFFNSKQLLQSLKHRMENARYASSRLLTDSHFPDWTPRETLDPETVEWSLCAKIQFGILEIVSTWISQFMKDFRDFKQIQIDFKAFIETAEIELKHWETLAAHKSELAVFKSQFKVLLRQVNQAYLRRLYRPFTSQLTSSAPLLNSMLPYTNATDSELHEWLNHTHRHIFSQFAQVDVQDWMYTFHIFENQSIEESAFDFLPSRAVSDDVVIVDVLHMLNQVRYRQSNFTLLEVLPPAIARLYRLHRSLQNEILNQITSEKLSVHERSRLLEHYVNLVKFCQKRMSNFDLYHESAGEDEINNSISGIPSFISSCISSALVAPESRALTAAWHCVSPATLSFSHLNQSSESSRGSTSEEPLIPNIGWIFERMLEIACYVPSVTPGNSSLVNFDKQRYIYNFISNFAIVSLLGPELDSFISPKDSDDHRRDEDVVSLDVLRARAQYDLDQLQLDSVPQQAFSDLVRLELEKSRRDRRYERIATESKAQRTREMAGKMGKDALITPTDRDASRRSSSGTKSRLGVNSFLRAVRPISMVFSSSMSLDQVNTKK